MADDDSELIDSFELLAHPTRMGVLQELFEAFQASPDDLAVGFAELRKRVDAEDSGNFSYHLDRLVDWYVTESESGYRLTERGFTVVLALGSGTYGEDDVSIPEEPLGHCPVCDSSLEASFEAGLFALACQEGHRINVHLRPEALEDRTDDELVEIIALRTYHDAQQTLEGVCAACDGRLDPSWRDDELGGYLLADRCSGCGFQFSLPAGLCAVCDHEVAAFLEDCGADPRTTPVWELSFCRPGAETVVSTDPLRLQVDIEVDDERLAATVDGSGRVVRTSRYR